MTSDDFTILCFGDVVGRPGRAVLKERLAAVRERERADFVVVNAENASGGAGIDPSSAEEILKAGADVLTLGDHTYQRKEAKALLEARGDIIVRPANYPDGAAGVGWLIFKHVSGLNIGVTNLLGRTFRNSPLDCPFLLADQIFSGPLSKCDLTVLDMHAEATSEKYAMGRYLDGRASLIFGTHTHVQTADEHILPGGTAYITDIGMCGGEDSVIGMDSEVALARFLTGLPHAYKIGGGIPVMRGIAVHFTKGKATTIKRIVERGSVAAN